MNSMDRSDTPQLVAFAAGCFWHVEEAFRVVDGVVRTEAGYAGGPAGVAAEATPCRRDTGHCEAVRVWFDPALVSLDELIAVFWERHDPAARHRIEGGADYRYRSAIFVTTQAQLAIAERAVDTEQQRRDALATGPAHDVPAGHCHARPAFRDGGDNDRAGAAATSGHCHARPDFRDGGDNERVRVTVTTRVEFDSSFQPAAASNQQYLLRRAQRADAAQQAGSSGMAETG
ncbi:MAG: methionine sulfoxide reductase [Thermoleophilia bacterium]|nr:methionine sulfoxide reductase [Thermoleophilia bacterium]